MTSASAFSDPATPPGEATEMWNTRTLIAQHKLAAAIGLVLIVLLLVIMVGGLLTSHPLVVSDSTTCTAWGSANQAQQKAYGERYVKEHGPLAGGATDPASVIAAINSGCYLAYSNDVADNVNVVQAIKKQ
jgi:hypothetical protein